MKRRWLFVGAAMVLTIGFLFPERGQAAETSGKKLRVAVGEEIPTLDATLIYGTVGSQIPENWSEYLIAYDPDGNRIPGLATSLKVSPDGKKIEFFLRKGVKFHSGDPFTAKDVQFSNDRGIKMGSATKTKLKFMERFEIVDDYHVIYYLKAPDVTFISGRGPVILSKSYYDRVGEDKFAKQPVGTGPYKFVRYVQGEYVDIERFEDYWGDKPDVSEARIFFVPEDTTRLAKLQTGEVDFINGCPLPMVRDMEKKGFKIAVLANNHPTPSVIFSVSNPNVPWYDKRVRQAMAYAIDAESIRKNLLFGLPSRYPWYAPGDLAYDPNLKLFEYDPEKARKLLADAGYSKGFDLTLYCQMTGRMPMMREMSEAIASYFEAVGIRTKLVSVEYNAFYTKLKEVRSNMPKAEFVGWYSGYSRARGGNEISNIPNYNSKDGIYSVYYDPRVEKLIDQAISTVDDSKRAEVIKQIVKIVHEEVGSIAICNLATYFAMKKNIDFKPCKAYLGDRLYIKDVTIR